MRRTAALVLCLLLLAATPVLASSHVRIVAEGHEVTLNPAPRIVNGRTMVSLAGLAEALYAEVKVSGNSGTLAAGGTTLAFTAGQRSFQMNGQAMNFDTASIQDGTHLLVPLRAAAEALGYTVHWDGATRTVTLGKAAAPRPAPPVATGSLGSIAVRDGAALSDRAAISLSGLAPGAYKVAFRSGDSTLATANVTVGADGRGSATLDIPSQGNAIALVSAAVLMDAAGATLSTASLPAVPLTHIRHVLSGDPEGGPGYGVSMLRQARGALQHATFAARGDSVAWVQNHVDHVYSYITGGLTGLRQGNANPADNKDARGYALTRYAAAARQHAGFAAGHETATAAIKLHSGHVAVAVDNVIGADGKSGWAKAIADKAMEIVSKNYGDNAAAAKADAEALQKMVEQMVNGIDANGNGRIDLVAGEAGIMVAYEHAQNMGGLTFTR